jgi:uncharacterized protein YndB with AHSA1/START domain
MSEKNKLTVTAEPGKHEALMTREFDAPRNLVFKTMFSAESIPEWWGMGTVVETFDAKPGGSWSVKAQGNGYEYRMHGVFHEVQSPEKVIRTFEYMPGKVALETTTFENAGGRTAMRLSTVYPSVEDRDWVVKNGMEKGANWTYDKLEEVLKQKK